MTADDRAEPWWKRGVFYQIYPRSFADGNRDGVGDLRGIVDRLDHLVDLGVDAVWLSPFYRSPMRDFGYDISDHTDVDPVFGTMADFDDVVAAVHDRGLRLIVDFVPNHVSSDHPWFVEARASRDNPRRDWFVWADPGPDGGPPTNWTSSFTRGGSAWTLDERTGQYYLHLFLPEQPDVQWATPALAEAQLDVMRFWLDRGVDGFRIDVVNAVGKDPERGDAPAELVGIDHVALTHHDTAHPVIRRMRAVADAAGDTMLMGEAVTTDLDVQAGYQGVGDELHLTVNFASVWLRWDRDGWYRLIDDMERAYPSESGRWPSWVLSNHDNPRHRTRYGGSEARARMAAVLLLTVRGTPFLYNGEELGLEDAAVPADRVVDPGGRDGCRAPIPWTSAPDHGWGPDPWLPFPPEASVRSAEAQRSDPGSVLALYRDLLRERHSSPALQVGRLDLLDVTAPLLGYRRTAVDDERVVLANFGSGPVTVPEAFAGAIVTVASGACATGALLGPVLAPECAVVVRRS